MFDPVQDVPENEEQVLQALRCGRSEEVAKSLIGIFRCRLALGDSLLDAYEKALLAHVEAVEKREEGEDDGA